MLIDFQVQNSVRLNDISTEYNNYPGMGIYVINRDVMIKLVKEYFPTANDLRGEIIPGAISLGMKVCVADYNKLSF